MKPPTLNPLKPHQRLYALMIDVHTQTDNPAEEYPEFAKAPEGWAWGQREPRRPGVYLWRYTRKWLPRFRKVVKLPNGKLGTYSYRVGNNVPLDHLVGKGASSQWLLPTNQRQPTPTTQPQ